MAAIVSFKMEGQVTVCSVHRGHLRMLCLDPSPQLEAAVSLMEQIAEGPPPPGGGPDREPHKAGRGFGLLGGGVGRRAAALS